jgi:hypothetical protein
VGIRETLNKNPSVTTGATIALLVIALGFIIYQLLPDRAPNGKQSSAFFSDDDGANYFSDDINQIPPFDHGGKPAVRCYVFECGGTKFVGWLQKYTDDMKAKLADPNAANLISPMQRQQGSLMKKPGDPKWVSGGDLANVGKIMVVHCPGDGTDIPDPVLP